jgi:prohibitin 2
MAEKVTKEETEVLDKYIKKLVTFGLALLIVGAILFVATQAIFLVPAGHAGIVFSKTGGGVKQTTFGEGWHVIMPIIETYDMMDVRTMRKDIDANAASKDLQTVTAKIALNYRVDKSKVYDIYQNVGADYEQKVIVPAIEEATRSVTAKYTAEELITRREEVASAVKELTSKKLVPFGLLIEGFSIINFDFSPEFNKAIEQKQVAEQEAAREKNILEKVKIQAEQRIAEADGIKQSTVLKAEGDAAAKLAVAEAEAKAISLQGDALRANPSVLSLRSIEKWSGNVPSVSLGTNAVPLLDLGAYAPKNTQSGGQ